MFTCGGADLQGHRSGPLGELLGSSFAQMSPAVLLSDLQDQRLSLPRPRQLSGGKARGEAFFGGDLGLSYRMCIAV